jgi:hypothetical protein
MAHGGKQRSNRPRRGGPSLLIPFFLASLAAGLSWYVLDRPQHVEKLLADAGVQVDVVAHVKLLFPEQLKREQAEAKRVKLMLQQQREQAETDRRIQQALARANFYQQQVLPLIDQTNQADHEAITRCRNRIARQMDLYHKGADRFVAEVTGLSTRFGVISRMPGAWWSGDDRIETYVRSKFHQHVFTDKKLMADLSRILLEFREEINANQRRLLAQVQAAVHESDLPQITGLEPQVFCEEVALTLAEFASDQGLTSVENLVGALVLGEVGAFAARSLILAVMARMGPALATGAAAGAGAAVGGSAAGAGGGSLAGPVGTVVGFGVGLAVGLAIDWWMTDKFQSELSANMHHYLFKLEYGLIAGSSDDSGDGLRDTLPIVCDQLKQAYQDRFYNQIVAEPLALGKP